MGYEEVLKTLIKQAKKCKTRQEYLENQREIAISTKQLSHLIGVNIANVANKIRRLLIEEKIMILQGFFKEEKENKRGVNNTKYYVLKLEVCEEEEIWKK